MSCQFWFRGYHLSLICFVAFSVVPSEYPQSVVWPGSPSCRGAISHTACKTRCSLPHKSDATHGCHESQAGNLQLLIAALPSQPVHSSLRHWSCARGRPSLHLAVSCTHLWSLVSWVWLPPLGSPVQNGPVLYVGVAVLILGWRCPIPPRSLKTHPAWSCASCTDYRPATEGAYRA